MKMQVLSHAGKISKFPPMPPCPPQPYIEDIPYVEFDEGSLALMWDKRKGEPDYSKKCEVLWLGPYMVKKKSGENSYYLATMNGRKMPLSIDGSLLQPYVDGT
jgi:hypothetical protein